EIVASAVQTGGRSEGGEYSVGVVAEEAVAVLGRIFLECGDAGAVGEENVRAAVAVVIEDGHAAGHGLGSVPRRSFAILQAKRNFLELEADGTGRLCRV